MCSLTFLWHVAQDCAFSAWELCLNFVLTAFSWQVAQSDALHAPGAAPACAASARPSLQTASAAVSASKAKSCRMFSPYVLPNDPVPQRNAALLRSC